MNVLSEKITDKAFIGNLIPQKFPFVMVDSLIHFSEHNVTSGLTISEDNIFTVNNTFNAFGLIENMAQTVALYTGYLYYVKNQPAPIGYIGAIKKAEIFSLPKAGQQLETSVKVLHDILGVTLVVVETVCEGKIIATSEMKTALAR